MVDHTNEQINTRLPNINHIWFTRFMSMANLNVFKWFTSPPCTVYQICLLSRLLLGILSTPSLWGPRTGIVFNSNWSLQFWNISNIAGDTCCLFQGHILKGFLTRKQPNLNMVTLDLVRQKHQYWCIINAWSLSDMDRAGPECFQKSICYLNYKHRGYNLTGWCY